MISTYQDLKAAVLAWLDLQGEPDIELVVDTLISGGEARVNRELRLQGMLATIARDSSEIEEYPLPDDYLELDRIRGADGESLESVPADDLYRYSVHAHPEQPVVYAIDGRRILFSKAIGKFTLRYYARLPAISQSAHWLFLQEPMLYLYAALQEAAVFSKEAADELARYAEGYSVIAQGLIAQDAASQHARSQPLRSRVNPGRKPYNRV